MAFLIYVIVKVLVFCQLCHENHKTIHWRLLEKIIHSMIFFLNSFKIKEPKVLWFWNSVKNRNWKFFLFQIFNKIKTKRYWKKLDNHPTLTIYYIWHYFSANGFEIIQHNNVWKFSWIALVHKEFENCCN
jgi:hypothetical protein